MTSPQDIEEAPKEERRRFPLEAMAATLLALALAIAVRWPLSVNLDAIPLDPNTPLHTLALKQLGMGGPLNEISDLGFPNPIPVRMIAFPTLLLGLAFSWMDPLAAMNVATTGIVAIGGLALWGLAKALGYGARARFAALAVGILAPWTVHVQALGQQENLAFAAMALAAWAGAASPAKRFIFGTIALLIAAFSSPYQAVPTGLILLCVSLFHGRRELLIALAASLVAAAPTLLYYGGLNEGSSGMVGITTSPPEDGYLATTTLSEMVRPQPLWNGAELPLPTLSERLATIDKPVQSLPLASDWEWFPAHQSSYIGIVCLLGLVALAVRGRSRIERGVLTAAAISTLFALGPELRLGLHASTGIPLPWATLKMFPGLDDLTATHRFISGAAFASALGVAHLVTGARIKTTVVLAVALFVDSLLLAPVRWPLPAAAREEIAFERPIPPGPAMVWPPISALAPQFFELLSVVLERPVGIFAPSGVTLSGEVKWDGPVNGVVRVDIVEEREGEHGRVIHGFALDGPGPFEERVAVDLGRVTLFAFIDERGDGPSPGEPRGELSGITISNRDHAELEILLEGEAGHEASQMTQNQMANAMAPATIRIPEDVPTAVGFQRPSEWLERGGRGGSRLLITVKSDHALTDIPIFQEQEERHDLILSEPVCATSAPLCWQEMTFRQLHGRNPTAPIAPRREGR